LSGIASLVQIDCAATHVSDLAPVASLSRLQVLDCHRTLVNDLAAVTGLSN
jgi:internalin A